MKRQNLIRKKWEGMLPARAAQARNIRDVACENEKLIMCRQERVEIYRTVEGVK